MTPTVAMGTATKHHPVPDRVKPLFVIFDIRALYSRPERQSARASKITNDELNPVWHQNGNSGHQRAKHSCMHVCRQGESFILQVIEVQLREKNRGRIECNDRCSSAWYRWSAVGQYHGKVQCSICLETQPHSDDDASVDPPSHSWLPSKDRSRSSTTTRPAYITAFSIIIISLLMSSVN